jgi:hypothetical protein
MNLGKAVNHGDTADTAKNQKSVFAFASRRVRRVAVVNVFESVFRRDQSVAVVEVRAGRDFRACRD